MPGICVIHAENTSATCLKCLRGHVAVFRDGLDCSGENRHSFTNWLSTQMGLLAGICWTKSQKTLLYIPQGKVG